MKSIEPKTSRTSSTDSSEKSTQVDIKQKLLEKDLEIERLQKLLRKTEQERTRERKYSIGFISQMFRNYWGYDDDFNSQMSSVFDKINTETPINEQMDTVFELQSTLQVQAKKMKLFHGSITSELGRLKEAIERFPVLVDKLSRMGMSLENAQNGANIDRIRNSLNIATEAITYLEESTFTTGKTQIPAKYKNELAGIISSLNLPSQESKKDIQKCFELIKDGDAYTDLAIIVINLLRTITRAFNIERESFLGFLEEFYENINVIQNSISDNITLEHKINKKTKDSNKQIDSTISAINTSLDLGDTDFKEISCMIKERLQHLAEIVREHNKYLNMQDKLLLDLTEIEARVNSIRNNASSFKEELQDISRKSKTDPLTGLYNRLSFDSIVEKELLSFHRDAQLQCAVPFYILLIDINNFGDTNRKYGANVGDKILRVVALTLKQNLRSGDFLAHLEADKYALMIHEALPENIHRVASKLISAIKGIPFHYNTEKVNVSISISARKITEETSEVQTLLEQLTNDMKTLRRNPDNAHFSIV